MKNFLKILSLRLIFLNLTCPSYSQNFNQVLEKLVRASKDQITETVYYNPSYQKIEYPNGDVPRQEGVCTDVLIRSFRKLGLDLQKLIHEDMKKNWASYPKLWGLSRPDSNIDHRRVPNLMKYFTSQGLKREDQDYQSGDIVVWDLGGGVLHIGLLSTRKVNNTFLVIHNICCGVKEENILNQYKVVGHFRLTPEFVRRHKE